MKNLNSDTQPLQNRQDGHTHPHPFTERKGERETRREERRGIGGDVWKG